MDKFRRLRMCILLIDFMRWQVLMSLNMLGRLRSSLAPLTDCPPMSCSIC